MTESLTAPPEEIATEHDESAPGAPRWVKALGIVVLVLLVAFLALHLTGHVPFAGMHAA